MKDIRTIQLEALTVNCTYLLVKFWWLLLRYTKVLARHKAICLVLPIIENQYSKININRQKSSVDRHEQNQIYSNMSRHRDFHSKIATWLLPNWDQLQILICGVCWVHASVETRHPVPATSRRTIRKSCSSVSGNQFDASISCRTLSDSKYTGHCMFGKILISCSPFSSKDNRRIVLSKDAKNKYSEHSCTYIISYMSYIIHHIITIVRISLTDSLWIKDNWDESRSISTVASLLNEYWLTTKSSYE